MRRYTGLILLVIPIVLVILILLIRPDILRRYPYVFVVMVVAGFVVGFLLARRGPRR